MSKLGDMKIGDAFLYGRPNFNERLCTIVDLPEHGLCIKSLTDGWEYLVEWTARKDSSISKTNEVRMVEMPKTALELIEFIRKYQYHYDED